MANWKLYWVESNGYENCFIVAKNSQSAKSIELKRNGFSVLDVNAFQVMEIPEKLEKESEKNFLEWSKINAPQQANSPELQQWPWYTDKWLLKKLGGTFRNVGNEEQILFNNIVYARKAPESKRNTRDN